MRLRWELVLFAAAAVSLTASAWAAKPRVSMETVHGTIVVELDTDKAPVSANNFLRYVDESRFSAARFYRAVRLDNQPGNDVKIEVLQGGLGFEPDLKRLPEIAHETTEATGLRHRNGTISMARAAPGTASSEFFICIGDQPELDFGGRRNPDGQGFSVFGRVIEGMDVVKKIHAGTVAGQILEEPVAIRMQRVEGR